MSLRDQIVAFANRKDWIGCEAFLTKHPPGSSAVERSSHAYWSVRAPMELGRFDDALRRLDALVGEFQSGCMAHYLRCEIYSLKGDRSAAIESLRSTPWGQEMDRFPALAKETMFLYCYFLAEAGREAPHKLVDAISADYRCVQFDGTRVDKADLLAAIKRNRESGRPAIDG